MSRISDETLHLGVNNEIEEFQRHLTDEDGAIVRDFNDIDEAISPFDGQSCRPVNLDRPHAATECARGAREKE